MMVLHYSAVGVENVAFPNRAYDRWNNDNRESSGSGYKGYDHDAILYDGSGIVTLLS